MLIFHHLHLVLQIFSTYALFSLWNSSTVFSTMQCFAVWTQHNLFLHSPSAGQLGTIMSKDGMDNLAHDLWPTQALFHLGSPWQHSSMVACSPNAFRWITTPTSSPLDFPSHGASELNDVTCFNEQVIEMMLHNSQLFKRSWSFSYCPLYSRAHHTIKKPGIKA